MKLHVDLSTNPYDILIERGSLTKAGEWARSIWNCQKIAIITDNHVGDLYANQVKSSLEEAGFEVILFEFLEGIKPGRKKLLFFGLPTAW